MAIPLGLLTTVTGVSGSGKSTLINEILYRSLARTFFRAGDEPGAHSGIDGVDQLDKVIQIDQSPIGRTPRSNPATYTGLFTFIRDLFAMLPDAKARAEILRLGLQTPKLAGKGIEAIIKKIVPMTKDFSGARLRQLCDESKRNAMKRTGFTQVAAPTIADVLAALEADKANKAKGKQNG